MNFVLVISALLIVGGPAQIVQDPNPPKPLFNTYFAKPTGNNGYEDYIRAADLTVDKKVVAAVNRSFNPSSSETILERNRAAASVADSILRLIREGNAKPAFDPRTISVDMTFQELSRFRVVAKILNARAYCEYSNGNVREGTRILFDILRFADNIPITTLIAKLVSTACKSIAYSQLSERLSMLGLPEAETMNTYATDSMTRVMKPELLVEAELQFASAAFSELLRKSDRKELLSLAGVEESEEKSSKLSDEDKVRAETLKKMSDSEVRALLNQVLEEMAAKSKETISIFSKPEKDWNFTEEDIDEGASLAKYIASLMTPTWIPVARILIVERTALRLLRVHAAIIIRNWSFGRLPASLSELENPALFTDPLTGKPFKYAVKENIFWELESEGLESTGPIALRYRRVFSEPTGGDPEPPLAIFLR